MFYWSGVAASSYRVVHRTKFVIMSTALSRLAEWCSQYKALQGWLRKYRSAISDAWRKSHCRYRPSCRFGVCWYFSRFNFDKHSTTRRNKCRLFHCVHKASKIAISVSHVQGVARFGFLWLKITMLTETNVYHYFNVGIVACATLTVVWKWTKKSAYCKSRQRSRIRNTSRIFNLASQIAVCLPILGSVGFYPVVVISILRMIVNNAIHLMWVKLFKPH